MPNRTDLDGRYASAKAEAEAAEEASASAIAMQSAATFQQLKRLSIEQRFEALSDPKVQLSDSDRRALVMSVRSTPGTRRAIGFGTATRLEIWRSRLRDRWVSLGMRAFVFFTAATLAAIAEHQTPVQLVRVIGREPFQVLRTYPSGLTVSYEIRPGTAYPVMRLEQDRVQLRDWEPGAGYATFWVQRNVLAVADP